MIKTGQTGDEADLVIVTTAGEALSARDSCYLSSADGKAYKTDSDDLDKLDFDGFAQEAAALNATVRLNRTLPTTGFSGLTPKAPVYISATAGGVTHTPPTNAKRIGIATSATVIQPDLYPSRRVIVFTASGTWTKRPGLKSVEALEVQGAGGAGSASGSVAGAGGGGGAYAKKFILFPSALGSTETVTVGTAGLGSGNTSFGAHVTAGNGGNASTSSGGSGGTAAGGDINLNGQAGQNGETANDTHGPGNGGNSMLGKGGIRAPLSPTNAIAYNGQAGFGYGGGGGGGAAATDSSPDGSGGAGTPGIVILIENY